MKVKSESEVAQSCPTVGDPTDCSLPGSSAHGIFQARGLEWGAIAFSVFIFKLLKCKLGKRNTPFSVTENLSDLSRDPDFQCRVRVQVLHETL